MSTFYFKEFAVRNEISAMKVNTDGVLLGAICQINSDIHKILDIGTGTGTIALMLAQRVSKITKDFNIDAIDIDIPSIQEASINFESSKWNRHIKAQLSNISSWSGEYDLIVSNPPYFDNCMKTTDARSCQARHTDSLSYKELINFASIHLNEEGILAIILPQRYEDEVKSYCKAKNIHISRILRIRTSSQKEVSRIVFEIRKKSCSPIEEQLSIKDNHDFTQDYRKLIKDFYLWA